MPPLPQIEIDLPLGEDTTDVVAPGTSLVPAGEADQVETETETEVSFTTVIVTVTSSASAAQSTGIPTVTAA